MGLLCLPHRSLEVVGKTLRYSCSNGSPRYSVRTIMPPLYLSLQISYVSKLQDKHNASKYYYHVLEIDSTLSLYKDRVFLRQSHCIGCFFAKVFLHVLCPFIPHLFRACSEGVPNLFRTRSVPMPQTSLVGSAKSMYAECAERDSPDGTEKVLWRPTQEGMLLTHTLRTDAFRLLRAWLQKAFSLYLHSHSFSST